MHILLLKDRHHAPVQIWARAQEPEAMALRRQLAQLGIETETLMTDDQPQFLLLNNDNESKYQVLSAEGFRKEHPSSCMKFRIPDYTKGCPNYDHTLTDVELVEFLNGSGPINHIYQLGFFSVWRILAGTDIRITTF